MSLTIRLNYDLASGPGGWDEFQHLATTLKATCTVSMNCSNQCGLMFNDKPNAANRGIYDPSQGGIVIYTTYEKQWETAVHEFAHHLQYSSYCENVYGWHSYHESIEQEDLYGYWKDKIPSHLYAAESSVEMCAEAFRALKCNLTFWGGDEEWKKSWEGWFKKQPKFKGYFIPGMLPPPIPPR